MESFIESLNDMIDTIEDLADEKERDGLSEKAQHLNDAADYLYSAIDELEKVGLLHCCIDYSSLPSDLAATMRELSAAMNE